MEKNGVNQYLIFIELILYWEGRLNTKSLERQFGLSRQQSSQYINEYKKNHPDVMEYRASEKCYCVLPHFSPHYISNNVDNYLHWLNTGSLPTATNSTYAELLNIPSRQISPETLRGLVRGVKEQLRVEVNYISLNNPDPQGRIIAPHSFVKTGLRWHIRAWCEKSRGFRDFVLSRFQGEADVLDKTQNVKEVDDGWNTPVTIILAPDQRLPLPKRRVLERDYGMEHGELHLKTRACLVQYVLREMQVSTKVLDGTPEAQQLVCVNLYDIKRWLFEG